MSGSSRNDRVACTSILPLQAEHIDACARLVAATPLWSECYGVGYYSARARFEAALSAEVFVALCEDVVVGFVWFAQRGAFTRSGYICLLGVRPDRQGHGVGTQLMTFAEKRLFATDDDIFLLVSSFNERAQRFYHRRGYEKVGVLIDYVRPGIDEFIFRKRRPE